MTGSSDEDGRLRYEFRDKAGQLLCYAQYVADSGSFSDTYYVYDCFGNLRAVFPPEASRNNCPPPERSTRLPIFARGLGYFYRYGRPQPLYRQKLPGAEEILYVYDDADQLVFTQDGEQRSRGEWSFALSDGAGTQGGYRKTRTGMSGLANSARMPSKGKP
ncbi:MAG: hypothetical protein ACLR8Y_10130 [Alistipes indistinctus]